MRTMTVTIAFWWFWKIEEEEEEEEEEEGVMRRWSAGGGTEEDATEEGFVVVVVVVRCKIFWKDVVIFLILFFPKRIRKHFFSQEMDNCLNMINFYLIAKFKDRTSMKCRRNKLIRNFIWCFWFLHSFVPYCFSKNKNKK